MHAFAPDSEGNWRFLFSTDYKTFLKMRKFWEELIYGIEFIGW